MLDPARHIAIESAVQEACDVFRGTGDIGDSRDFVLAMLLLKYLSDIGQEQSGLGTERTARFVVPRGAEFRTLHAARNQPGNGLRIDQALGAVESHNVNLLGVFRGISFEATVLGNAEQKERLLCRLLDVFGAAGALDFRKDSEDAAQSVALACDSLIRYTATITGKRGVDFFTPHEISQLIARLLQPKAGESIGDPCCGSGSLLIACSQLAREQAGHTGCALYGQEKNGSTWAMARMNMILHGETQHQLEWGDTLRDPKLLDAGSNLRKFDVVVSSPPFNLRDWAHEGAERDIHQRYWRGVPPRTAADFAFLSHMVQTLNPNTGRMAAVVSLGVLFRGAAERQIRERLVQENLIDAVIALPPKMFPHTAIPVAILLLRQNKADEGVLFIDASGSYQHGKTQNILRQEDLERIEFAYRSRKNDGQYARLVTPHEISANDYNLSVARYVNAIEDDMEVDLIALREERARLKTELAALEDKLLTLSEAVRHV